MTPDPEQRECEWCGRETLHYPEPGTDRSNRWVCEHADSHEYPDHWGTT